jgi:hypothetical protein
MKKPKRVTTKQLRDQIDALEAEVSRLKGREELMADAFMVILRPSIEAMLDDFRWDLRY